MSILRCTGRDAITFFVEYELNQKKFTDEEVVYLRKQIASFITWLMEQGNSKEDAIEIVTRLHDQDEELLSATDPYHEFIWSRGEEVGDAEIDLANAIGGDFEESSTMEWRSHHKDWNNEYMLRDKREQDDFEAETEVKGYDAAVYVRSELVFDVITNYIKQQQGKKTNTQFLLKIKNRINVLRFGTKTKEDGVDVTRGGGELVFRHWAICYNMVNELLGVSKKITLPEVDEDEEVDALDKAHYFGLDSTSLVPEEAMSYSMELED